MSPCHHVTTNIAPNDAKRGSRHTASWYVFSFSFLLYQHLYRLCVCPTLTTSMHRHITTSTTSLQRATTNITSTRQQKPKRGTTSLGRLFCWAQVSFFHSHSIFILLTVFFRYHLGTYVPPPSPLACKREVGVVQGPNNGLYRHLDPRYLSFFMFLLVN
jgi:hypothetical protein